MTATAKKKVAVLMGGWSNEREVSLVSGGAVCKALEELGHEVHPIDAVRDLDVLLRELTATARGRADVVFNALHGRGGEDGTVQGLLEIARLPYTHSGVTASSVAMDKPLMKSVATAAGVRCAEGFTMTHAAIVANGYPMAPPFVVKPPNEGSSVGVRIVKNEQDLAALKAEAWPFGETVLVERFIPGHELTVAVLGDARDAKALAVTELRPRHQDFYDYTAKYADNQTDHLLPAPLPQDVYDEAMRLAVVAYKAAGCQGAARADFRWDETQPGTTGLYFLELNTQPGMTPLSLLPEQAKYVGMSFNELIAWMLDHPVCPA